jgi:hypothetical protein
MKSIDDIEDCLQVECAFAVNADYIITHDMGDFENSPIPVISPEDFLKLLTAKKKGNKTGDIDSGGDTLRLRAYKLAMSNGFGLRIAGCRFGNGA